MPKMIQIRNVPDEVHKALKIRAAKAGMSLSEFLLREVAKWPRGRRSSKILERIRQRGPIGERFDSVAAIREIRDR